MNTSSEIDINEQLFDWITNYPQKRTVYVSTDVGDSAAYTVTRGVPQGGVLTPTLFNICLVGTFGTFGSAPQDYETEYKVRHILSLSHNKYDGPFLASTKEAPIFFLVHVLKLLD